jgi:hypothetical protein
VEAASTCTVVQDSKIISTKRKQKFRMISEIMEWFCFVITVTDLNRFNTVNCPLYATYGERGLLVE